MFPDRIEPLPDSAGFGSSPGLKNDEFEFRQLASKVSQNIQKLAQHVSAIENVSTKIGTSRDNLSLQEDLQHRQSDANALARSIKEQLWTLTSMASASHPREHQRLHVQVEKLSISFSSTLRTLQNVQQNAARKARASVTLFKQKVEDAPLISMHGDTFAPSQDHQDELQQELFPPMEELRAREEAIRQLEGDIKGVNDIFKELASMVQEQGDVIDSIEAHVETTAANVENANTQLLMASRHQTSSRKKLFILLAIVLVVAIISALVIYFSTRKG